jgi:mannose-6-phosphate isomerase-like protein (cupin superfamily)
MAYRMKNIIVIETGIDVSKILDQLDTFSFDWNSGKKDNLLQHVDYDEFRVDAGVLQLVMGGVGTAEEKVYDTEYCIPTPAFDRHTAVLDWLFTKFDSVSRCGFLSMPVGGFVGEHTDFGNYYLTKDRFHLSIQGRYKYTVGGESVIVEPGTFLWFNNKLLHDSINVGDEERISFVFDVPYENGIPYNVNKG